MRTGIIGLGAMGTHMAANLHKANLLTAVWNRTQSKAKSFCNIHPCIITESPKELAQMCDVIIMCVSTDKDVIDIIEKLKPGLNKNTIIVDTSTIAPKTASDIATQLHSSNVDFLDAPVSGGVEGARNATLAMMVGGNEEALIRATPVLQSIAQRIVYMGQSGHGQATKAVNQLMAAGINLAVSESLALSQALDLPMDKVIDVISKGAAGSWFLTHRGENMKTQQYPPGFRVALHHKDLLISKQIADSLDCELSIGELGLLQYQALIEQGYGDEDISAMYRIERKKFGLD